MTDTTDAALDALVARLRRTPLYEGHGEESDCPDEAADAITALRAENAALRAQIAETEARGRIAGLKEAADKDLILTAIDDVQDMGVTLDDYAEAVSRAILALIGDAT